MENEAKGECVFEALGTKMVHEVKKCTMCHGTGKVPKGTYSNEKNSMENLGKKETCMTCDGSGELTCYLPEKEEEGFKIVRNADSELRSNFIELPVLFKNYDDREKIAELIGEKPEDTYIKKVGSFKKASIRAFNPSFHCDRETTTLYLDSDECCYIVDMSYEEFKKEVQPKLKRSWE